MVRLAQLIWTDPALDDLARSVLMLMVCASACQRAPGRYQADTPPSADAGPTLPDASDAPVVDHARVIADRRTRFNAQPADRDERRWVIAKLAHMVELDQYVRSEAVSSMLRWEVDDTNTRDLKDLLKRHQWFLISEFGRDADYNGWIVLQHATDATLRRDLLPVLTELATRGETGPGNYAYLFDRATLEAGGRQRYGTQGTCDPTGRWVMSPIEEPDDPDALDRRRSSMDLGPASEYAVLADRGCAELVSRGGP